MKREKNSGLTLWQRAKRIIPGGSQLLSKRSEQFLPDLWPSYYRSAKGVEVTDLDGRRYIDMSLLGVGACPLGYADPDVDRAVKEAIDQGSMCTLNCPEEVELAEVLLRLHPWAEMVRFARGGGEAMAVAVRIARARTGREIVAFCGYHGWHDWYLSANLADDRNLDGHLLPGLEPRGVPRGLKGTAVPFRYNEIEDLRAIIDRHDGSLAAVVMEPIRDHEPVPGFLEEVQELAAAAGALLVVDEVSAGFRLNTGGAHLVYGIRPDIAVFAKGMSNGYPMAAIIGTGEAMSAAQETFISSTYWTERIGPVAALATIDKYGRCNVPEHLVRTGKQVQGLWARAAADAGLPLVVEGIPPLSHFTFSRPEALEMQTAFTQMMLDRGFLAGKAFYSSFAHKGTHIEKYRNAVDEVFLDLASALKKGEMAGLLKGPVAHAGFGRLT
ncbi:MAG: aminotransferase class III-fold pyridoxal phosphate-dependent enzyme [Methanomicrobiales archaeon]